LNAGATFKNPSSGRLSTDMDSREERYLGKIFSRIGKRRATFRTYQAPHKLYEFFFVFFF